MPSPVLSEQRVKEIIASVYMRAPRERTLTWRDIGDDDPLYSLEEEFDVVLPAEIDPTELRTVRQVLSLLARYLAEQRGGE